MNEEIIVLAHSRAKPGKEKELESVVRKAILPTHAEKGCIRYAFNQSTADPQNFVMIEKWTSKKALDEHLASPHIKELFAAAPQFCEKPVTIEIYRAAGGGLPEKLL